MSAIQSKILAGAPVADAEWELYLAQAHREVQSMTPRAYGAYRTSAGQSSYEVLAKVLEKKPSRDVQVLDLGCGDGYLVQYLLPKLGPKGRITGVDLVPSEVERAKSRYADKRVQFVCARAQELPLPASSVDLVLCHLTLMLMRPIEPVLANILKVLKPGGELAGILPATPGYGTPALELANLINAFVDEKQPRMRQGFVPGDPRFATEQGMRSLFSGFRDDLWVEQIEIFIPLDPEAVWSYEKDMYLIGALPPPQRLELKGRIDAFVAAQKRAGAAKLGIPLRIFQITR